jgi:predicted phage tail protein
MVIAYLVIGFVFGGAAAALTWVNGGGILLGLAAYSAGGALAILSILAIHMILSGITDNASGKKGSNEPVSA